MSFFLLAFLAAGPATYEVEIAAAVSDVRHVFDVPPALVKAVIHTESAFNPRVVSRAGAVGLMQVMPFNAPKVGLTEADLWHPERNVLAGVRLLAVLLLHYQGDLTSALAAYNARPRKLYAPLPRNGETPKYVQRVLQRYAEYSRTERAIGPMNGARINGSPK